MNAGERQIYRQREKGLSEKFRIGKHVLKNIDLY